MVGDGAEAVGMLAWRLAGGRLSWSRSRGTQEALLLQRLEEN